MGDTCTVCGHSYELGVHVYCLWPLQCILFVATPTIVSTIIMLVCIIIVGVEVLASARTCTGFVIVLWIFQYYTQIVSTILGVPWG